MSSSRKILAKTHWKEALKAIKSDIKRVRSQKKALLTEIKSFNRSVLCKQTVYFASLSRYRFMPKDPWICCRWNAWNL